VEGETDAPQVHLFIDGAAVTVSRDGRSFTARRRVHTKEHRPRHSEWREPYGHIVLAVASGNAIWRSAAYAVVDGVA
jgi:amidase